MATFTYLNIDTVQPSMYANVFNGKKLTSIKNCAYISMTERVPIKVEYNPNLALNNLWKNYCNYINGLQNPEFVDPGILIDPLDQSMRLTDAQIRHRVLWYSQIVKEISDDAVLEYILRRFPKKKDGALPANRILMIASLPIMREDEMKMTQIYASAKTADVLCISSKMRQYLGSTNLSASMDDLCVETDMFVNL